VGNAGQAWVRPCCRDLERVLSVRLQCRRRT
jgi:hypothetical protein